MLHASPGHGTSRILRHTPPIHLRLVRLTRDSQRVRFLGRRPKQFLLRRALRPILGLWDAHDRGPERAARAAMAMLKGLRRRGVSCGIGVTSGRTFCGVVGSGVRCEYALIGDAVNMRARFMAAAKDQVLGDAETYRLAGRRLETGKNTRIIIIPI